MSSWYSTRHSLGPLPSICILGLECFLQGKPGPGDSSALLLPPTTRPGAHLAWIEYAYLPDQSCNRFVPIWSILGLSFTCFPSPGEWTCCILSSRTALLHSLTTISSLLAATGSSIQTRSGSLTFFQNYTIKNWIQKALSPLHWPICRWTHHKSFCCQTKVIQHWESTQPSMCLIISILSMKVN